MKTPIQQEAIPIMWVMKGAGHLLGTIPFTGVQTTGYCFFLAGAAMVISSLIKFYFSQTNGRNRTL